jgi:hypothetical protein
MEGNDEAISVLSPHTSVDISKPDRTEAATHSYWPAGPCIQYLATIQARRTLELSTRVFTPELPASPEELPHVGPRHIAPVAQHALLLVEQRVQHHVAHVGRPDLVRLRVCQGEAHPRGRPVLVDRAKLVAQVAGRLLDAARVQ